jgi:DNA adenine methylase
MTEATQFYAINALAPWFGAKRTLAPRIVEVIGKHSVYWEPFCGSMAILLSKEPCTMETVNDLHGDLINLARVLQHENLAIELYSRMSRIVMHEGLIEEARQELRQPFASPLNVTRAVAYMVAAWCGRNGVGGTDADGNGFCVRYTSNGGHAAKRFRSAIESIPGWHERLRNVTILGRDAMEIIERIEDKQGTVIYCDPPYVVKGAKYVHDFEGHDHQRLAELLNRFRKTRVVVSYYEHPLLDELYKDWAKIPLKATKALANQGMRDKAGAVVAPEVLLVNERHGLFGV